MKLYFSIIVPVYNRPNEVLELLQSLSEQSYKRFEVLVVDDGSTLKCNQEVDMYTNILNIKYYEKKNTGPGNSRNYGIEKSLGNYYIFLDSDCTLPKKLFRNTKDIFRK